MDIGWNIFYVKCINCGERWGSHNYENCEGGSVFIPYHPKIKMNENVKCKSCEKILSQHESHVHCRNGSSYFYPDIKGTIREKYLLKDEDFDV